ncbi:MAG: hypothetical protein ACFCVB_01405 [Nodosilinea sp.]
MTNESQSQSISISGGTLNQVQIGGQAGGDLNVQQVQGSDHAVTVPDQAEAVNLIQQLADLMQALDLPDAEKTKAQRHLDAAQEEVQQPEPDKPFALKNLQRATQVLTSANEVVEASSGLGERLGAIAARLAPWFGVAAKTLLLL